MKEGIVVSSTGTVKFVATNMGAYLHSDCSTICILLDTVCSRCLSARCIVYKTCHRLKKVRMHVEVRVRERERGR